MLPTGRHNPGREGSTPSPATMNEWRSVPDMLREDLAAEIERDARRARAARRRPRPKHGRKIHHDQLEYDHAVTEASWRYARPRAANRARAAREAEERVSA